MTSTIPQLRRALAFAQANAEAKVAEQTKGEGHIARGLSREGYMGGYIQALDDVMAVITHGRPADPRGLWPNIRRKVTVIRGTNL